MTGSFKEKSNSNTASDDSKINVVEAAPSVSHRHEGLGGGVELERNFSFLSCLGLAFALINSWTGKWKENWSEWS